jgi:hypothetical protein
VKREAVKAQSQYQRRSLWWPAIAVPSAVALAVVFWIFSSGESPIGGDHQPKPIESIDTGRFSATRPVTQADLETLRWEEVDQLVQATGADTGRIDNLIQIAEGVATPPTSYLRALLLIVRQKPEEALAAFDRLDPQTIPPAFLYAPYRLQQTLHPDSPNPYLSPLRKSVAEGKVPSLTRARVQASDGDLREALLSYLRTDPASWAHYDIESLRRIDSHQGLAPDLRRLIVGALASGRVQKALVAPLQDLARGGAAAADTEEMKRQLRRAIETKTPAGQIAVESAKKLIKDRNLFVERKYSELIAAYRESEPAELSTETVLLLFLSAVELEEQIEMDRWGQELKRRHGEVEVRDWVNEMTGTAR